MRAKKVKTLKGRTTRRGGRSLGMTSPGWVGSAKNSRIREKNRKRKEKKRKSRKAKKVKLDYAKIRDLRAKKKLAEKSDRAQVERLWSQFRKNRADAIRNRQFGDSSSNQISPYPTDSENPASHNRGKFSRQNFNGMRTWAQFFKRLEKTKTVKKMIHQGGSSLAGMVTQKRNKALIKFRKQKRLEAGEATW